MATTRLPLRVRAALVLLAVVAIVVVGGATAAVQVGARAVPVGGGFTVSTPWSADAVWAGIELENRTGFPITLHAVEARTAVNVTVLDARVIRPHESHLMLLHSPLTPDIQAAIDDSSPVEGFVLPPHSRDRFQIAVLFRPRARGEAMIARTAITYSLWGVDHGSITDGVYCVRAPGARDCSVE
jgi:hypothetical protein